MTTAVTLFEGAPLPAHVAAINAQTNIVPRVQVDTLSFRGKNWRVTVDGTENLVTGKDGDPVQVVPIIILDYNKDRSRAFYPPYVEGQSKPPICWSNNGIAPDKEVQEKQNSACATCKQSAKGSKMLPDGTPGYACSQFKRMVSVPAMLPDFKPLLTKIPQTSMWDKDNKENESKGWYAFDQYMDMLASRGVNNTASVITKVKFDSRKSFPKLLFSAATWLPEAAALVITKKLVDDHDRIEELLALIDQSVPAEEAPKPEEFSEPTPAATAAPAVSTPATAPAATPAPTRPARPPRPAAAPAAAPAPVTPPPAAAAPADEDDDMSTMQFMPAAEATAAVAAAKTVNGAAGTPAQAAAPVQPTPAAAPAGDGVAQLLQGWPEG